MQLEAGINEKKDQIEEFNKNKTGQNNVEEAKENL